MLVCVRLCGSVAHWDVREAMMERVRTFLREGVEQGVYPGAVLLVAHRGEVVFHEATGYRSVVPVRSAMKKETIFDLASLTKPLATVLAVMSLVAQGKLGLDEGLRQILGPADLKDKGDLTIRLLLVHSAGLADWKPFYVELTKYPIEERKRLVRELILQGPFAYPPGQGSLYSDLGFMLLEWVIERKSGEGLAEYVGREFYERLGLKRTFFARNPLWPPFTKGGNLERKRDRGGESASEGGNLGGEGPEEGTWPEGVRSEDFAATEDCPWRGRILQGEVHDENAYALGGCSAHAGLFGTAEEVWTLVNLLRQHSFGKRSDYFKPETLREFFRRQEIVKGSDWALGWDTRALEGSSAGRYFSRDSVGHTGFTGTSIWMDLEKDVAAILLSNRVHPTRGNPEKMKAFRPKIHDKIMQELGLD